MIYIIKSNLVDLGSMIKIGEKKIVDKDKHY